MKKKLLLLTGLLVASALEVNAIDAGTDMTSYIKNNGFESTNNTLIDNVSHEVKPEYWTFTYSASGWLDYWVTGSNSSLSTCAEGKQFYNVWADSITFFKLRQGIANMPEGTYTLTALMRGTGSNTAEITDQHAFVESGGLTYSSDTMKNTNMGSTLENWQKLSAKFYVFNTGDSIYVGVMSKGDGTSSNGWFQVDDFHLTYDGALDESSVLPYWQSRLQTMINTAKSYEETSDIVDHAGLGAPIDEYLDQMENNVDKTSIEAMKASVNKMDSILKVAKQGVTNAKALEALLVKAKTLQLNTSYPGAAAYAAAITKADAITADPDGSTSEDYAKGVTDLTSAIKTYRFSQTASAETPADYTFLISCPNFSKSETVEADSVRASDGWVIGSTYTGGDQRTYFKQNHTIWNAWWSVSVADAGTQNLDIHQNLADLPSGYYAISCLAITNVGCISDQHAYVASTAGTAVSPKMTIDGWPLEDPNENLGTWDSLATAKILVSDGKLAVGFTSTKTNANDAAYASDNRDGWWCVTHFRLYYYGAASDDELVNAYNAKLAAASAMADTMHFAADKAALKDSITLATGASGKDAINKAMETLTNAMSKATTSENKYTDIMAKGKSIPTLKDSLATGTTAYGAANEIVSFAYNKVANYITSSTATYSAIDAMLTTMKGYTNTYCAAYDAAADSLAKFKSTKAISELNKIMALQKTALIADTLVSTTNVNTYITQLNKVLKVCVAQQKYENGAKDFTFMIQNPDAGGKTINTTGWTIVKGFGDKDAKKDGQHYNSTDLAYFDSWNSTAGKLNYYGYQKVNNIPNGTYMITAACRTSGSKGAFLFGSNDGTAKTDTIWKRIEIQKHIQINSDGTRDTTVATDKYGQIWEDANAAVAAGTATSLQTAQALINNSIGRGWEFVSVENINVTNHSITIGMCTDSLRTGEAFNGSWFSVVDFSLVMTSDGGDNTGWDGPITGINKVKVTNENIINGVYNLSGVKMNSNANLPKGIYIIRENGKAKKVLVR